MSLYIISQLLIRPKDVVLVGDLSHYAANMIFQQSGAIIKTIPIDEQGLDVDYIKTRFVKGNAVFIFVLRDYPTTVSLTAERRLKLAGQFAIIEDDYDYDFQFEGLAMLPMAAQMQMEW
jgi:GntR family transcriptional regulator/MocR family aminotransferase